MGCLRLTYSAEESPLRVSRDEENVPVEWKVWTAESTQNQHKEEGVQTNGGDQARFGIPDNEFGYDGGNVAREVVGGSLVRAGQPSLTTRAKPSGATPGTSPASKLLRKLFPQELKSPIKIPTGNLKTGIKWGTKATTVGSAAGRLVPWVGWGLLAWDVVDLGVKAFNWFVNGKEGVLDDITFSTSKPGFPSVK